MDNREKNLEAINSEINEAIDEVKNKNENVEIEVTEEAPAPQEDKVAKQKDEDAEYGAKVKKRIKKLIAEKHEAESEALNLKSSLKSFGIVFLSFLIIAFLSVSFVMSRMNALPISNIT